MRPSRPLLVLILANLVAQLFDGLATYVGWQRFGEANPLLYAAFGLWGAGTTLVVAKSAAAALILLLARAGRPKLVGVGLSFTLLTYVSLSLVPWSLRLFP